MRSGEDERARKVREIESKKAKGESSSSEQLSTFRFFLLSDGYFVI